MPAATDFGSTLGGVLVAGLGLLFTVGSCWWIVELLRMRGRALGTVVAMELGPLCETLPVVSFTSHRGEAIRFTGVSHIARSRGPGIGKTVPVRYDLGNPAHARIATLRGSFVAPAIGLLAGVALLALVAVAVHHLRPNDAARVHDPADRRAVYLPLRLWATKLDRCAGGACTVREEARTLGAYDRAKAVAMRSGEVSPVAEAQIARVEPALVVARFSRRGIGRSARAPLLALVEQLLHELSADGCDSACVRGYRYRDHDQR